MRITRILRPVVVLHCVIEGVLRYLEIRGTTAPIPRNHVVHRDGDLEAEGLIEHVKFGKRTRYYKFNETSPKAIAVRNLIEIFET